MRSSLAAEQVELLQIIEHLERVAANLDGENAGVSKKYAEELQRLRERVLRARSQKKLALVAEIGCEMLVKIAVELFKAWP